MEEYSEQYKAKCIRRLKELGAPIEGWYCLEMYDVADGDDGDGGDTDLATCDLCGCSSVRYVHVMRNEDWWKDIEVGCICAGIMEGDILAAKARDNAMKNRAKRKRNFPKRKWRCTCYGNRSLIYHGKRVFINVHGENRYNVCCGGQTVWQYKGRPINNFLSAVYAAFDLVDPAV